MHYYGGNLISYRPLENFCETNTAQLSQWQLKLDYCVKLIQSNHANSVRWMYLMKQFSDISRRNSDAIRK